MIRGIFDMPYELFIDLPTNKQILPVIIAIAVIVVVGLIITFIIFKISDKLKEKNRERIAMKIKHEKVMDKVVRRETEPTKTVHQIKRESRDPAIRQQQEAAVTNTLVGGTSEAQKVEKHPADYCGVFFCLIFNSSPFFTGDRAHPSVREAQRPVCQSHPSSVWAQISQQLFRCDLLRIS